MQKVAGLRLLAIDGICFGLARQTLHFCGINVITAWKKIQSTWKILIFVANIVLEDIAIVTKSKIVYFLLRCRD